MAHTLSALPLLQLGPVHPSGQAQRPVNGWQRPPLSHRQRSWQPRPNLPNGQTKRQRQYGKIYRTGNYQGPHDTILSHYLGADKIYIAILHVSCIEIRYYNFIVIRYSKRILLTTVYVYWRGTRERHEETSLGDTVPSERYLFSTIICK